MRGGTDWLSILKNGTEMPSRNPRPKRQRGENHQRPRRRTDKTDESPGTPANRDKYVGLTVEEALEEMSCPKSGPGIQARLDRAGEIGKENAIEWISCAIIRRREGKEAQFDGWQRHARVVEEALKRFCGELSSLCSEE